MEKIVLVGFGGHAKSVIDVLERQGKYEIVGYTDIQNTSSYQGYHALGPDEKLKELFDGGVKNACISIGYMGNGTLRDRLYKTLKEIGYNLPIIVDPSAIIADNVTVGEGTFVGKNAIVNADSHIGKMCIINTGAIVEHENTIGDFTHVAVRATLCGNVMVQEHCMIGAGATVIEGTKIAADVVVGAGAVVVKDINHSCKVVGVPAKIRG